MSVSHALLALLSEGPSTVCGCGSEFEARTGEVWPLNVGQVYTTLQRLERDGLVESDDGDDERSAEAFQDHAPPATASSDWLRTPPDFGRLRATSS